MSRTNVLRLPKDAQSKIRSLWIEGPGRCAVREEILGEKGSDSGLLVETLFTGISRGTERMVLDGGVPESEFERMKAPNQNGEFSFPLKYGYSAVGRVVDGPENWANARVFSFQPHQTGFISAPSKMVRLPEDVPAERAVLGANMETALNVVWDAGVQPGDRVTVFGAGVVGALVAYLAGKIVGTEVTLCDVVAERSHLAGQLGVDFALPDDAPEDADVAINCSASDEGLAAAIGSLGMEGRVVEASWYGERMASLPLGGAFHAKRLSIVSSQVGAVPASRAARWDTGRRLEKAIALLADPRLDCLISGETPFDDIADAYPAILAAPDTLCHRIRY